MRSRYIQHQRFNSEKSLNQESLTAIYEAEVGSAPITSDWAKGELPDD